MASRPMASPGESDRRVRGAAALVWVLVLAALALAAALAGLVPTPWGAPAESGALTGARVRRGPLPITVVTSGSLDRR